MGTPSRLALLLLLSCTGGEGPVDGSDTGDATQLGDIERLTPVEHAVRASMVLRGVRPTADELRAVHEDPALLEALVDAWLDDPRFGETVRELENQTLLTRVESWPFPGAEVPGYSTYEVNRSVFTEPLRLIERVVSEDRPYTEIVTADTVVADEIVSAAWVGIAARDPDGPEWQELRYVDGRPPAGILMSGALWFRHRSATNNYNRGRANAVSRALLCHDYLHADVVVDQPLNLVDDAAVADLVREEPACRSCHQTLDPLASFFWVFPEQITTHEPFPYLSYQAETADAWAELTGRAPALSGVPGDDIGDLGQLIAADPRFPTCTARRWYGWMAQIPPEEVPVEIVDALAGELVDSGWSARAMARAAVLRPEFAAARGLTPEAAERVVGYKLVRSDELHRMFEELIGFRWTTTVAYPEGPAGPLHPLPEADPDPLLDTVEIELNTSDYLGYRVLAGGMDSFYTTQPVHTVNTTASAWLQRHAAEAAAFAVSEEFARPAGERRLLTLVEPDTTDPDAVRRQLAELYLALFGELVEPDSEEIADTWSLFDAALALSGDPERAWLVTLTALFQDVRIAYY